MRTPLAFLLLGCLGLGAFAAPQDAGPREVHTDREGARPLPLPKGDDVFHFVVFGDRTTGPAAGIEVLRQAVRDTNLLDPDLVMTVGDLVQGYNRTPEWMVQMKEYRAVMDGLSMPWFPVAGNHDVYWRGGKAPEGQHEGNFEKHFGPLWYWFEHKDAAFVVLYSDEGDRETNRKGWGNARVNRMSAEQLGWLEATLQATKDKQHVFLFLHHPRWIGDYYKGTNWDAVHALLVRAGNVTAVFGGHIHRRRYDGERDGIEYFALATTGGDIPFDVPGTGHLHHLDVVTVRKGGISLATVPVGKVLDPREMTPERWREIDLVRSLWPLHGPSKLVLGADGSGQGSYRVVIPNPTERMIEVNATVDGADRAWTITPDHTHTAIEAGKSAEIAFRWRREEGRGLDTLGAPTFTFQVDYLAESARVSTPERTVPLALEFSSLPESLFAAADAAARLDKSVCLSVPAERLDLPDGPLTVEGWLRPRALGGRRAFLAKTEESEFGLFVTGGKPAFSVHLNGKYSTAGAAEKLLTVGRWHHLAGVFDGAEVRLYVDGKKVAAVPAEGARTKNRRPFLIGADPDRHDRPTSHVQGRIDEVRVSTVARYSGDTFTPARRVEPDADTALLLHLDRPLGPLAPDHSPHGRHAQTIGKVVYDEME